jgi:hypothetical protein
MQVSFQHLNGTWLLSSCPDETVGAPTLKTCAPNIYNCTLAAATTYPVVAFRFACRAKKKQAIDAGRQAQRTRQ